MKQWMKPEQKQLLKPFSDQLLLMAKQVMDASDNHLRELEDACAAATDVNCGWDTYAAAQFVAAEIRGEKLRRQPSAH